MSSPDTEFNSICGAVVLELDENTVANMEKPPKALTTDKASILVNTIAANMNMILGDLDKYGIIVPAALYDQTEILTPGFTVFNYLQEIYVRAQEKEGFTPSVIALGSEDDGFPIKEISPKRESGFGNILVIPFAIVAPKELIDSMDKNIDYTLLESGALSDLSLEQISEDFGIKLNGGFFASLANLCAFLKTQLEKINCSALWEIFEQLFFSPDEPLLVTTATGNKFYFNGEEVITPFMTYADWLAVMDKDSDADGYTSWVLTHRQYTIGLQSHGVNVTQTWFENGLISNNEESISSILNESTPISEQFIQTKQIDDKVLAGASSLLLTEQFNEDIGTIAFVLTTDNGNEISKYYPLSIDGIAEAEEAAKEVAKKHELTLKEDRTNQL